LFCIGHPEFFSYGSLKYLHPNHARGPGLLHHGAEKVSSGRTGYATSRGFVTKTDSGGTTFNLSEVVANGLEAGLSNAYYPPQERGLNQTAMNWGTQMGSAVLNHIFQEFWPDIRKKLLRQK
jgi:hypothetical protein